MVVFKSRKNTVSLHLHHQSTKTQQTLFLTPSPKNQIMSSRSSSTFIFLILGIFSLASQVAGECTCEGEDMSHDPNKITIKYKIAAIVAILISGGFGVSLPIVGKNIPAFIPASNFYFLVKAFAAGVILSTGFIHILPDAFDSLTSPCLKDGPWVKFPFAGLAAMLGSLGTLTIEYFATGYYARAHRGGVQQANYDEEKETDRQLQLHSHGRSQGSEGLTNSDRIKYKVTSQVLELGIIVHSIIIGMALGTSQSLNAIKPLMAALCFHQCFEGIGLGGCIAQASFKSRSVLSMGLFFSLTTPVGIAVGIGIMRVYNENSPTALIIQGLLNACAAGILIYMALVDLLAQDLMSPTLQSSSKLFLITNISSLLGAGFMAVLAIWA